MYFASASTLPVISSPPLSTQEAARIPKQKKETIKEENLNESSKDKTNDVTEDKKKEQWEQISEITKSLKALARELEIPIVALCQVARDAEGQEPNLAQLRGSGSIEQDADVVMFLHRDRLKDEVAAQDAKIILAKQRNGATGDIQIMYIPGYTKFENKAQED